MRPDKDTDESIMVTEIHEPGRYCAERRDEIIAYVFREMGPGAAEAFEAHIASCAGCSEEVDALRATILSLEEIAVSGASEIGDGSGPPLSMEEEWSAIKGRLKFAAIDDSGEDELPSLDPPAPAARRTWMPAAAAAVAIVAFLSFSAGYLWRSRSAVVEPAPASPTAQLLSPPVSGAATGNYFDHIDDFRRDTHNFLRRTRMLLMEFTNLGDDSDASFFRVSAGDLRDEADRYRPIAIRMNNRKLAELLDQISGILTAISAVTPQTQRGVVADVTTTMELTDLLAKLELLDSAVERTLEGQPNV